MTYQYPALFFGIELEFNIAWLYPWEPLPSHSPTDTRAHAIRPSQEILNAALRRSRMRGPWKLSDFHIDKAGMTEQHRHQIMKQAAQQALRKTFAALGLPVEAKDDARSDYPDIGAIKNWDIKDDGSILPPSNDLEYGWTGIEIVSPAYKFTPENIQAVKTLCDAITTNYITHTDAVSTGLHVHISFGADHKWSFPSIKHGLLHLDACESMEELLRAATGPEGEMDRLMAYNVVLIYENRDADMAKPHGKTTLEFRQHKGTLDGERVTQWIELLCGVIIFLENVQLSSLFELFKTAAKEEAWVKTGITAEDERNERELGPILAESRFMITDLLGYMGLQESADYYRSRLHKTYVFSW